MLVGYTPRAATVLADESVVVVVDAVRARPIIAFPTGWIVVVVAGIVLLNWPLRMLIRRSIVLAEPIVYGLEWQIILVSHCPEIVVLQGQYIETLLGLPNVQPQVLRGAELLRLIPTDRRIHQTASGPGDSITAAERLRSRRCALRPRSTTPDAGPTFN